MARPYFLPYSMVHLIDFTWNSTQTSHVAMDFRKWLGGEGAINTYCHKLALDGGKRLAQILGTKTLDETGEFTLNMVGLVSPSPCPTRSQVSPDQRATPAPDGSREQQILRARDGRRNPQDAHTGVGRRPELRVPHLCACRRVVDAL